MIGKYGAKWGRKSWLRYNKEYDEWEMLCSQCESWQTLDRSMWRPTTSLQTCIPCLRVKNRRWMKKFRKQQAA